MGRKPPVGDVDEDDLDIDDGARAAAGPKAVAVAMKRAVEQMGVGARRAPCGGSTRSTASTARAAPGRTRTRAPAHRRVLRERRQGRRRGGDDAPRRPGVLRRPPGRPTWRSGADHWLGQQGRLTEPMVLRAGRDHYEPIGWDDAFGLVAGQLRGLATPDEAVFYTSGAHQQRGRVRLPAVRAGLRHQQPAGLLEHVPRVVQRSALAETIGIGKGSVSLEDVHRPSSSSSWARTRAPTTRAC